MMLHGCCSTDHQKELMTLLRSLSDTITAAVRARPHFCDSVHNKEACRFFYKAVHDEVFEKLKKSVLGSKPLFHYTGSNGSRYNTDSTVGETEGLPQPAAGVNRRSMTVDEVNKLLNDHRTKELPGFIPYGALVQLINTFQGQWDEAVQTCLAEMTELLEELLSASVKVYFSRFPKGLEAVW
jgi:hypothetical protein